MPRRRRGFWKQKRKVPRAAAAAVPGGGGEPKLPSREARRVFFGEEQSILTGFSKKIAEIGPKLREIRRKLVKIKAEIHTKLGPRESRFGQKMA